MLKNYIEKRIERLPESGCWIWTEYTNQKGYGQTGSRKVPERQAHRLSWVAYNGLIEDGLHVLHKCDVPSCVNPDHLFLGTNADNIKDSVKKGRRKGITRNRPSGLSYEPMSKEGQIAHMKIKPETRQKIIDEYSAGGISQRALGKKYGCSCALVCRITGGEA